MLHDTNVFNAEESTSRASIQLQLHRHRCVTHLYRLLCTIAGERMGVDSTLTFQKCQREPPDGYSRVTYRLLHRCTGRLPTHNALHQLEKYCWTNLIPQLTQKVSSRITNITWQAGSNHAEVQTFSSQKGPQPFIDPSIFDTKIKQQQAKSEAKTRVLGLDHRAH